jgi:PAS domain S-box-containing protein
MSFQYLSQYARFLLAHHLDELTALNIERAKQVELPLLKLFADYSPAELLEYSKRSLHTLLLQLAEGVALKQHEQNLQRWRRDQIPDMDKAAIDVQDLALSPHTRRYALRKLLKFYTNDWNLYEAVLEEIDWYYTATLSSSLETYVAIQQEHIGQQRDFLEMILDTTQEGISALDTNLNITLWNKALEERTGISREVAVGQQVFKLFPSNNQVSEQEAILQALQGEKIHLQNLPIRSREGYYDIDILPLRNKEGVIVGTLSFSRDVTEKTRAAQQLQGLNQALSQANEVLFTQQQELEAANIELQEQVLHLEASRHALAESKAYLREAQAIAHLGHWRYQVAEKQLYWSEEMYHIYGTELLSEELEQDGYLALVHPQDQSQVRASVNESVQAGHSFSFEHRILRSDGTIGWVWVQGKGLLDAEGNVRQISGTCLDITGRKGAEEQLKAEQYFVQALTDASPDVITLYDLESMRNLYSSREIYSILGYSEQELKGIIERGSDAFVDYFHPEDLPLILTFLEEYKQYTEEAPREMEYRIRNASGEWVSILDRYRVFKRNEAGLPTQIMGVARDITERKRAEREIEKKSHLLQEAYEEMAATQEELRQTNEELYKINLELEKRVQERTQELSDSEASLRTHLAQTQQLNQQLDQANQELRRANTDLDTFVYMASHDLRAPIANLIGFQRILTKRLKGKTSAEEEEILSMMNQGVERLSVTINVLTEVVKVQKERLPSQVLSFEQMLEEVKLDLSVLQQAAKARIRLDLQVPLVSFPRQHLRSILYNLLSNALKYRSLERPLEVRITTFTEGNYTVFCLEDNGLGLAPQQLGKLFQMFKRLHTHVEGTGIGLYMIKRMIDNYGGRIEVESKLDEGTQFKVYFPN